MMFGSLAAFRTYCTARGYVLTPTDDVSQTAALVRATDNIQYAYVNLFVGGADSSKAEVEFATYETAVIELAKPGFFSKTYTPSQVKVLSGVEGIRWSPVASMTGRPEGSESMPRSTLVEAMLSQYMPGRYAFGMTSIGLGHV